MTETSIEWTDKTWNPTRGCSRVSEGCRNCYAERVAARFSDGTYRGFAKAGRLPSRSAWTGKVDLVPKKLEEPLRWREPQKVFVNSMSDLFHESLSDKDVAAVFVVMALAPRHTFQVLTKRPERMRRFMNDGYRPGFLNDVRLARFKGLGPFSTPITEWPPRNVWLGVSVEDQKTADERVPILLETRAAKRFVSYEPALGPVDFNRRELLCKDWPKRLTIGTYLDWIIVGGESGPGARPFDLDWARETVRQCRDTDTAVFVKQLGALPLDSESLGHERYALLLKSRKGGDMSEWPESLRVREFPA